eukprot:CAMPEP_0206457250 /NCGR_PEP_ID=MMETSP0324_2-20121206/22851_1 /ASSEMBLY_ACC=CAM_ASM_000836 /TAXON_ID=2866 /ORGANISM="Crypthecodinium cohnii, Strain Seligo" /LENGTH=581 /DNA_ID=CAMNT_0053928339 /DNA_START=69 /DNA_END=1810 /DNA_ORIENTATION=-
MLSSLAQKLSPWDKSSSSTSSPPSRPAPTEELISLGGAGDRRRLRHISQVALRFFNPDPAAVAAGYVLELLIVDTNYCLERSVMYHCQNPTWALIGGEVGTRQSTVFEIRASRATSSAAGGSPCEGECFWRQVVALNRLEDLHCKELSALPSIPPASVPLLEIDGAWFCAPPSSGAAPPSGPGSGSGLSISTSTSSHSAFVPPSRAPARTLKEIKITDICSHGDHISAMLQRLQDLRERNAALREAMSATVDEEKARALLDLRRARFKQRVLELRALVEERRDKAEQTRSDFDNRREQIEGRQRHCADAREALRKKREEIEEERRAANWKEGSEVKVRLRSTSMQLRCRQMKMLHEVCQVFPIENHGNYWTIRGLSLVTIEKLCRQDIREEENVSTALGFLTQMIAAWISILAVPLRMGFQKAGSSRAWVDDQLGPLPGASGPFPNFPSSQSGLSAAAAAAAGNAGGSPRSSLLAGAAAASSLAGFGGGSSSSLNLDVGHHSSPHRSYRTHQPTTALSQQQLQQQLELRSLPLFYSKTSERRGRFEAALRLLRDGLQQFIHSRGPVSDARHLQHDDLLECA